MKISKEKSAEKIQFWAKPNGNASCFSIDELIEIGGKTVENINKEDSTEKTPNESIKFFSTFDHLIHVKNVTEGRFPNRVLVDQFRL